MRARAPQVSRGAIDPQRWREISPGRDAGVEAEIGAALRAAASTPPWDDLRVAQLRQNVLRASAASVGTLRRTPAARALGRSPTWALAAGCLLLGAAATAVAGYAINRLQRTAAPAARQLPGGGAPPPAPLRRRASARHARAELTPVGEAPPAPVVDAPGPAFAPPVAVAPPAAAAPPAAGGPPARRVSLLPPPTLSPGALPSSAAPAAAPPSQGEADELGGALRLLRRNGDPRGALAALDAYETRHPAGALAHEAVLARAEALLALGRDAAALDALDGLALDGAAVDRPVALARAELRAAAGRCADAAGDFARARGGDDAIAARALYGEGVCHLRAGDRAAARAAFMTCRRRFPDGPWRADVDRALAGLGP